MCFRFDDLIFPVCVSDSAEVLLRLWYWICVDLCSHGMCDNITLTTLPEVDIVVAERLHASKAVTTNPSNSL